MAVKRGGTRITQAEIVKTFGRNLRAARLKHGLSQQQVASKAQIHVTYVGRLERGEAAPGLDLVQRLAESLGAPLSQLLPEAPQPQLPVLQAQTRRRIESILRKADEASLSVLLPILAMIDDGLAQR